MTPDEQDTRPAVPWPVELGTALLFVSAILWLV